jgi:hypothetical protein
VRAQAVGLFVLTFTSLRLGLINWTNQAEGSIARMLDSCLGDRPTQAGPIVQERTLGGGGGPRGKLR